ncbi:MAG: HAD-IC family P-type ATPase [Candidatus Aminicenantales bacterium]
MDNANTQASGLSSLEAKKRLAEFGPNRLARPYEVKFLAIVKEEVTEPMILLLLGVGVVYSLWGKLEDALTIFSIIIVLTFVEVWNEFRAKKAIASLTQLAAPRTKVIRDGGATEIETEGVVPGDILLVGSGSRVAADARLVTAYSLQADESSLTGESLPVVKAPGDEISAGTLVVAGEGRAEVTATGVRSRFGRISALAQTVKPPKTPLQLAMKDLAMKLVWVALFFSAAIPLLGVIRGQNLKEMILTGLALAFATIPEEGPIIITMILGLGAYKLSKNNFLIKKIKATEVLGNATVILTDKTGTLTENEMSVVAAYPPGREKDVLSSASSALSEISMFATDKAVADKARELGVPAARGQIVKERGFGDGRKTKTVLRREDGGLKLFMSGSPEELFKLSGGDTSAWEAELAKETGLGRRVIAVAAKSVPAAAIGEDFAALEQGVTLVGLMALEDLPRQGVEETLNIARKAGVRTIMVTGDHPLTALTIARKVGISADKVVSGSELDALSDEDLKKTVRDVSVFARATPEHKYRLLRALQANGEIVAVTGDGVNDTLALKGANIGIAMGIKGTDAAKEAADVVLADDNYNTIARAIFEGRKFFDNLRKGFGYYLSVKTALVLVFMLPVVIGVPFPFSPVQIILLELFMDLAASSGFVAEPAEKTIYRRPPRDPKEKFINAGMLRNIAVSGLSLFAAVMIPYGYALSKGWPHVTAQTIAFSAWIIGHILLAFVSRSEKEPLYSLGVFSNKAIDLWAVCAFAFLLLVTRVPALSTPLKLQPIPLAQLGLIFLTAFVVIFWREIPKLFSRGS